MIIRNEKLVSHRFRLKVLTACQVPQTIPELMQYFELPRQMLENHVQTLIKHGMMKAIRKARNTPTQYLALVEGYAWVEPEPPNPNAFETKAHDGVKKYGDKGIYLLAHRPAKLEVRKLPRLARNAVSGSTLGGAYYDY